jgi:hypothetical protein
LVTGGEFFGGEMFWGCFHELKVAG